MTATRSDPPWADEIRAYTRRVVAARRAYRARIALERDLELDPCRVCGNRPRYGKSSMCSACLWQHVKKKRENRTPK